MCQYHSVRLGFAMFALIWNKREGRETPDLHLEIADWLEQNWLKGHTRLLLMAFRASGKSTLVGLFAAWLLYTRPDLRILVLAADYALAAKMVQQVKKIIEHHPLIEDLKPEKLEQWAGSRFTVKRRLKLRDPSMLAHGVTSNITGSRADIVICDDVEVPKTCDTSEKRGHLRTRLTEISYVLGPGGTQLYVGTPHSYYSIYAGEPRAENNEEKIFLEDFERLLMPVLDEQGQSAWPEKFTPALIEKINSDSGPHKFISQMMLLPMNIADARLDPDLLDLYDDELDYTKELQTLFLGTKKLVAASAWWDPAFGSPRGDNSVFAAVFIDEAGDYYLHCVEYIKGLPPPIGGRVGVGGQEVDEATSQCRIIARLAKKLYLPSLTVENNGIGGFLPGLLKNETAKVAPLCAVVEKANTKPKDVRILEAFDTLLAAGKIHVHKSVLQTPFMREMQEWQPGRTRGADDGLDAVAGALSQQPVRMKRIYSTGGKHDWTRGKKIHKAKTEFEV